MEQSDLFRARQECWQSQVIFLLHFLGRDADDNFSMEGDWVILSNEYIVKEEGRIWLGYKYLLIKKSSKCFCLSIRTHIDAIVIKGPTMGGSG